MALEEFTGDLRNGPVELPCHTQRLATQRNAMEENHSQGNCDDYVVDVSISISKYQTRFCSGRKVIGVTIPAKRPDEYPRRTRKSSTRLRNQYQRAWQTRREESGCAERDKRSSTLAFLSPAVRSSPASELES